MRENLNELKEKGWELKAIPFELAVSPDGKTVGMKCMTCDTVIKGVMVANKGLVRCRDCAGKSLNNILSSTIADKIADEIIRFIKKIK